MTIRRKLQILSWGTALGLAILLVATIGGFNAMQAAEATAQRRAGYALKLVEIKASAISTIMLDPTLQETRDVFAAAERTIGQLGDEVLTAIKRPEVRDELKQILSLWSRYDRESQAKVDHFRI